MSTPQSKQVDEIRDQLRDTVEAFREAAEIPRPEQWRVQTARDMLEALERRLQQQEMGLEEMCRVVVRSLTGIFYGYVDASEEFSKSVAGTVSSRKMHDLYNYVKA